MNLFEKGIKEFNDADFFAAHDSFETLWFECRSEEKLFYQGLVQISVGFYHLVCGNLKGALSQFSKGSDKLNDFPDGYKNISVEPVLKEVKILIRKLKNSEDIKEKLIDIKLLPKIIFRK